MEIQNVPKAVAIIPDGNRRWARGRMLTIMNGYNFGIRKFMDFAEWCKDYGVRSITVWGFSTENFKRSSRERTALFNLYRKFANDKEVIDRLCKNKTRFRVIGNTDLLPRDLLRSLRALEVKTGRYRNRVINMLIAYGGGDDILHAVQEIVKRAAGKGIKVTGAMLRSYLLSSSVPDLDLVIRTSGEERLSGFMPIQSGYSELYFVDKYWPDFTKQDLERALVNYSRRKRRFGE